MYQYGRGVQQSYTEAVRWARSGARQGNATAQVNLNLGLMYTEGQGVPQDLVRYTSPSRDPRRGRRPAGRADDAHDLGRDQLVLRDGRSLLPIVAARGAADRSRRGAHRRRESRGHAAALRQ